MANTAANNKRIAKNTLLLYFRMIILMLVALYTSRVILDALGEVDYGIYNVIGGVVAMFSVLSGTLSGAISRFITYELGTGDKERLKRIFCTSVNIQVLMAALVFLLCEVIGAWFLNTQMNIPSSRMEAANWVLHFSIATFAVNLISLPYNATIIAHEKMNVFAYISILEAVLKLAIAYLIYVSPIDKLFLYGALMLGASLIVRGVYGFYCGRYFEEAKYHIIFDRSLVKEMGSFGSWNLLGSSAYMFNTQGVNMLINVYFGVTMNAARAIAVQVDAAVTQFVSNFMTAINPSITKSYAAGDTEYMVKLVCQGTKYSFFIMYLFIVPLVLEAETILSIWLKQVPEGAVVFTQLVLFSSLATLLGNPMFTAIMATGKIKRYQIEVVSVGFLVFPLTWVAYETGLPAYSTYIIYVGIYLSLNFIRLSTLKRLMNFPVGIFLKSVLGRIAPCAVLMFIVPCLPVVLLQPSFSRLLLVCATSFTWSLVCIYYVGLEKRERNTFIQKGKKLVVEKLHIHI